MNEGLLEDAVTNRPWNSFGAPELMAVKATETGPASSLVVTVPIGLIPGASFTGMTVNWNEEVAVAPLVSRTVRVTFATPNWLVPGKRVTVRFVPAPVKEKLLVGVSARSVDEAVTTRSLPGVSMSNTVNAIGPVLVSSSTLRLVITEIVGGSFTSWTVRTNVSLLESVPSLTVTLMVAMPDWFVAGVTVSVRAAPPPGAKTRLPLVTSVGLDEAAETVRAEASDSMSLTITTILVGVSSRIVKLGVSLIVGASLIARTSNWKLLVAVAPSSSVIMRVIVATPFALGAGVTVIVRLEPLPPKTMFAFGTRAGFEQKPVSTRLVAGVSKSPTRNGILESTVSSSINRSEMKPIVGDALARVRATFVLFAGTGSKAALETEMRLVCIPGPFGATTIWTVAAELRAILPRLQVTRLPLREQVPWLGVWEMNVTLGGSVFDNCTEPAVVGPRFVTVIV